MIDDQTPSDSPGNDGEDKARAMNYMVEVFLDKNKYIRRTKIHHVQSDQEITWDNWDDAQLLAFFKQRPELRFTKQQQAVKKLQPDQTEEVETAEITAELVAASAPASETTVTTGTENGAAKIALGMLHLRKMEIIPRQFNFPISSFNHKQPFNVRLRLDLSEMKPSEWGLLNYSVDVIVKRISGGRGQKVINGQGPITSNSNMTLNLKCSALPPGNYRISAVVTISPKDTKALPRDLFTASYEGGLLQIW